MELLKNRIYKHYKGDLYLIIDIALDVETEKQVVIYRGLYRNCKLFVRTVESFKEELSEDVKNKYGQKYRFELMNIDSKNDKYKFE